MKKSYHCKYGANITTDEVIKIFQKLFDMEFELHESSYVGMYFKYTGLFADKVTINPKESASPDCLDDKDYEKYSCLIFIDNNSGKNADKLSKTKYLKFHLAKISDIVFLHEKIIEEKA
ncbi:hypothetical protein V8J88_23900 [Massilia sp. W12]|uniref:hypothetical protein n=1 Tax=Massilia sp. W12 TaxID=3126507 RepID=UPI0030D37FF1